MRQGAILLDGRPTTTGTMACHGEPLWRLYDRTYEVSPATTQESSAEAYALRYQVYCLEKRFEDPAANPLGLELDAFDSRSVHCLLRHRDTGIAVGTARLIRPNPWRPGASWPIQQVCRDPRLFDDGRLPLSSTAEVSRFCLSVDAKARVQLAQNASPDSRQAEEAEGRLAPYTILGIIRGLLMLSRRHDITHWTLVVEPALLRLLGRLGLHFTKLGPVVEYHGRRQPCFAEVAELLDRMSAERPDLWSIVTGCGRYAPEASRGVPSFGEGFGGFAKVPGMDGLALA
jgi:N-acyl amino acid synthase of PEP-CTERM/exosortase system